MGESKAIDLELEAVTPLWMGGASYQPELRPPSVRGCLRFWLRALLGGSLGENLKELRQAEMAVFGSPQRASPVVIRMRGTPQIGPSQISAVEYPGVGYMLWSVYQRKRDAILPGATFDLRLQCRRLDFAPVEIGGRRLELDDSFELAAASLWLLLRLGGVGARMRRGVGGIQARRDPRGWPASLPSLVCQAQTPSELAKELSDGLRQIRRVAGWQTAAPQKVSSFDVLHPEVSQIYVIAQTFASWWEALDWVGQRFQTFRREYKEDASAIAELLKRGRLLARTIQRAALGLPIAFFFKSILGDFEARGVPARDARRRASASITPERGLGRNSPLYFRVVRIADVTPAYAVVMLTFRAELLRDGKIRVRPQDRAVRPVIASAPADFSLIDRWIARLAKEAGALHKVSFD